jgi:hypothetical protein
VRAALVWLSVAGALVAIALGARDSWSHLSSERSRLTDAQAERAAAVNERLPMGLFDRMRARVGRGERWWLDVPDGSPQGLTTRWAVYRTYALYWLLPALPASSPEDADEVFRIPRAS